MRLIILAYRYGVAIHSRYYRLCNLDNGEIIEIKELDLVESINKGEIVIENLSGISKGRIVYSADYMMVDNEKVREPYKYYIVESKNNRHIVCDYYGKFHTLDNNKMAKLKREEIMNPMECSMEVDIKDYSKRTKKYIGEVITNKFSKLTYVYRVNKNKTGVVLSIVKANMIGDKVYYAKEQGHLSQDLWIKGVGNIDGIATYDENTIITGFPMLKANENNPLMSKLITSNYFMSEIDKNINDMKILKAGKKCSMNKELDMPLPTKSNPYSPIIVNFKDLGRDGYTNDINLIRKYARKISLMDNEVFLGIPTKSGKVALVRDVNDIAITYKTIGWKDSNVLKNYKQTYIEEIFNSHEEYANVVVRDNIMVIYGLDGVYKYDMDRIYGDYNNQIMFNRKTAKAKVLGIDYKENITESGVLTELTASSGKVVIPETVRYIDKGAIKLGNDVTELVFPTGLELLRGNSISIPGHIRNLKIVVNTTNSKARLQIMRYIKRINYSVTNIVLDCSGDISEREFIELLGSFRYTNSISIVANNFSTIEKIDDSMIKILNYLIKSKYETLSLLGNRDKYEVGDSNYYVMHTSTYVKVLYDIGEVLQDYLLPFRNAASMCSVETQKTIYKIIDSLTDKLENEIEYFNGI